MNTSGWIRGHIAHNSPNDRFIRFLVNTISKEFDYKFKLDITPDTYNITMGKYKVKIEISKAKALQLTEPYALDKYILDSLKEQGLEFSQHRSQYIRYCYGLIENV